MRLIDADKVYEVLTEYYHHRTQGQHDALQDAISRVPTIEINRWIPVTERLPEKNARYLVTNSQWGYFEISINAWIDGEWLFPEEDPIAWMPLPEPWEEDDNE